jgi:hypothetical protein
VTNLIDYKYINIYQKKKKKRKKIIYKIIQFVGHPTTRQDGETRDENSFFEQGLDAAAFPCVVVVLRWQRRLVAATFRRAVVQRRRFDLHHIALPAPKDDSRLKTVDIHVLPFRGHGVPKSVSVI